MEDIIQKYKKEKKIRNISIVISSFALALALNIVLSTTDSGKYLKASVLNSNTISSQSADIYLENTQNKWNTVLQIKSSKDIAKVKSMWFSFTFDKDNVSIKWKTLNLDDAEILDIINNEWFNTISINFKNPTNIKAGDTVLKIVVEKQENKTQHMNIINANIIDNDENMFMLSTSGIDF